jgi:hypothetical protein
MIAPMPGYLALCAAVADSSQYRAGRDYKNTLLLLDLRQCPSQDERKKSLTLQEYRAF